MQDFSSVAEKTGTYTAFDYADIMDHLIKRWSVAERRDLTGEVSSGLFGTDSLWEQGCDPLRLSCRCRPSPFHLRTTTYLLHVRG